MSFENQPHSPCNVDEWDEGHLIRTLEDKYDDIKSGDIVFEDENFTKDTLALLKHASRLAVVYLSNPSLKILDCMVQMFTIYLDEYSFRFIHGCNKTQSILILADVCRVHFETLRSKNCLKV